MAQILHMAACLTYAPFPCNLSSHALWLPACLSSCSSDTLDELWLPALLSDGSNSSFDILDLHSSLELWEQWVLLWTGLYWVPIHEWVNSVTESLSWLTHNIMRSWRQQYHGWVSTIKEVNGIGVGSCATVSMNWLAVLNQLYLAQF
jgi:hypothetical protein